MRRLTLAVLLALMSVFLARPARAQTLIDNTTLSTALTGIGTQANLFETRISLTATTCTGCTFGAGTLIYVDHELMQVTGAYVSGSTNIPVTRGFGGTLAGPHSTSAVVFLGPSIRFKGVGAIAPQLGDPPTGDACVRSNYAYMPWINVSNGNIGSCDANKHWLITNAQRTTFGSVGVY